MSRAAGHHLQRGRRVQRGDRRHVANQSGLTLDVAAGSAATFTLTGSVAMGSSSDTTCQGATFTIPVTLTGISDA